MEITIFLKSFHLIKKVCYIIRLYSITIIALASKQKTLTVNKTLRLSTENSAGLGSMAEAEKSCFGISMLRH